MKLRPDWKHIAAFALAVAALVAMYVSGALKSGDTITVASVWAALGAQIWTLFQKNILQPDETSGKPLSKFAMKNSDRPAPPTQTRTALPWRAIITPCTSYHYALVGCVLALASVMSCAPAKTAINLAEAECKDLGGVAGEPAIEQFICDVIDATGVVVQTFSVKVAASEAADFASKHQVKQGHPAPGG